jgi:hypothetical protein
VEPIRHSMMLRACTVSEMEFRRPISM